MSVLLLKIVFLIVLLMQYTVAQHRSVLSGMVENTTKEFLPYATLRIQGTSFGTISNGSGRFQLELHNDTCVIVVSYLGYISSLIRIQSSNDTSITITLRASEVRMPEVVVIGEDPAYPIIREAIIRKNLIRKNITSYKARMYTKDTFGRDTILGMISEAYSDLYWSLNDSAKEVVFYRRQSSNLPKEFQLSLVRSFINFNDDSVYLWGYTFIAPLADTAFSVYEYRLKRTYLDQQFRYFDIEVIPKRQTLPLFSGMITIADSSFAQQSVKLHPNSIFHLPVISFTSFEISQRFSLYNGRYWFPLDYRIDANLKLQYMAVDLPGILFYNKSVICYEYDPSFTLHDTIRATPTLTMLPTAQNYDTSQWINAKLFPLTPLEDASYRLIEEKMKRMPAWTKVMMNLQEYRQTLEMIVLRYNRTEGLFAGINASYKRNFSAQIDTKIGYGFSDERMRWAFVPEYSISSNMSLKGNVYRTIETFPFNYFNTMSLNTISSFFNGQDYFQYYYRDGSEISMSYSFGALGSFSAGMMSERERSAAKNTDFSMGFVGTRKKFPQNAPIHEGLMRSLIFEFKGGVEERRSFIIREPGDHWNIRWEYSSPGIGSQFQFNSFFSKFFVRIPTMGTSMLFYPYLDFAGSGGWSTGNIPIQRSFAFEAPLLRIVSPYAFRTVRPLEFSGDRYAAIACEYNLRNIPFLALGIPSFNFDLILRTAFGSIRKSSADLKALPLIGSDLYQEYTFGLGRLGDILRIDFSFAPLDKHRYSISILSGQ